MPINILILGFSTGGAVALSNFTIVGGCLSNFAFNIGRRHPLRDGPLIDWDLALVSCVPCSRGPLLRPASLHRCLVCLR